MTPIRGTIMRISVLLILANVAPCRGELRLLLSVFRHGDRYPIKYNSIKHIYPLNPYANVSWFPDSDEGLTIEGKRRAFELGENLRERYGKWLGPIYSKRLVEFHCSRTERALITSSLVAAGLFPPSDDQRWNPRLNWQPIPVFQISREESILFVGILCSKYQSILYDTHSKDPIMVKYDQDMREFYEYVSRYTGGPVDNRILYYLHMELLAATNVGITAPEWAENIFPEGKLREAATMQYKFSSWTDELKRYTGGVWLQKWLDHVNTYLTQNEPNDSVKKKAFFYGGHDVNVAGIMTTLGIFHPHIPNYASAISFELHEDVDRHFYVKVLHRETDKFVEKLIPGCDGILCSLEIFEKIFAKVIPSGETLECGALQY